MQLNELEIYPDELPYIYFFSLFSSDKPFNLNTIPRHILSKSAFVHGCQSPMNNWSLNYSTDNQNLNSINTHF
jgi:hypothetical protein